MILNTNNITNNNQTNSNYFLLPNHLSSSPNKLGNNHQQTTYISNSNHNSFTTALTPSQSSSTSTPRINNLLNEQSSADSYDTTSNYYLTYQTHNNTKTSFSNQPTNHFLSQQKDDFLIKYYNNSKHQNDFNSLPNSSPASVSSYASNQSNPFRVQNYRYDTSTATSLPYNQQQSHTFNKLIDIQFNNQSYQNQQQTINNSTNHFSSNIYDTSQQTLTTNNYDYSLLNNDCIETVGNQISSYQISNEKCKKLKAAKNEYNEKNSSFSNNSKTLGGKQSTSQNNKKTRTKDKYRVVYNEIQRFELEKEFNFSKYITSRRKSEMASVLDLSQRQIKIWFQNRRAKDRKMSKKKKNDPATLALAQLNHHQQTLDLGNQSNENKLMTGYQTTSNILVSSNSSRLNYENSCNIANSSDNLMNNDSFNYYTNNINRY